VSSVATIGSLWSGLTGPLITSCTHIHRFWTEFDVEIASRIGRVWDSEGVLDQTALDVAENVLKVCGGCRRTPRPP
jgi:hypothetical protein